MRQIKKGSTDKSVILRIIDSTDGTPENGVVYNTSGIDLWYRREGGTKVSITEATLAALDTAHTDGGFLLIGDGYYRFDLPDAAFATGASHVMVGGTVTGMIVIGQEVQLVSYDPDDAVRFGLTSLPNAAADAAGGLPISDAGGLDLDTKLANTNEITAARMGALTDWINGGRLDLILDACAVEAGGNLATILGRVLGTIAAGTHNPQSGDAFARLGAPAGASISADVATRLAAASYTAPDNTGISEANAHAHAIDLRLPTDPADQSLVIAATDAITAAIAALPSDADVNAACDAAIADAALATAANLATVDTVVDGIEAHVHAMDARLPADPADESLLEAAVATRAAAGDAMALTSGERTALGAALGGRTVGVATQDQITRAILAALLAKATGGGTGTVVLRNAADTANLATVTVDENENRTAVVITWANA